MLIGTISFPVMLEKIETLYKTILAGTQASAEETDIDKQIAIEVLRKENLASIDVILQEIVALFQTENTAQIQVNEDAFLQQKERLLLLVDQIRSIDTKKIELIKREQSEIIQTLQSISLGKQAVRQYQKTML